MTDNPVAAGLARTLMAREVIGSVALSHEESCRCDVCRASLGDDAAFARVVSALNEMDTPALNRIEP